MPLHGKIVVIKRTGGDGTEFPLTAACLFGRKPDCDIRIQLPQVSKEHCRIDFNENKEIILTNLSSANPTLVNGEALQQSERLKHGDVITVIDRSFRFEYPPPPTPKKRSSIGGKTETFKVLQNQQVGDTVSTETGETVSTDPHLKDGTNHENIQRPLEKAVEMETKEGEFLQQSKTASPFSDLYQMIRKSLDVKTPRKSSASVLQTPASRFCTPKPAPVRKDDGNLVIATEDHITPKKDEAEVSSVADETKPEAGNVSNGTPKSVKKQRRSVQVPSPEAARPEVQEAANAAVSEATSPQKRIRTPPKRFTACEVVEHISATPKSPVRRRSKEAKPAETKEQEEEAVTSPKTERLRKASPRSSGEVKETSKKRKSAELGADRLTSQMKTKRVSFGGSLCPELFDKRLPPNSPLRKGADPRRGLCVAKPKESLLRRASAIGLLQNKKTPSPKATVQGRFSVSHIDTPSPVAEDAFIEQVSSVTATHPRRTCTSREAPSLAKVMRRRSGISRASMKVKNSWAEIVRFGQTKAQVVAPAKKRVTKNTRKNAVSKPQTPVRQLLSHVSTGHADSPVTIVVGRAHKQTVVQPTGAAPKLVPNIALFEKNTKTDENLTGISEMLKNPASERRTRSVIDENDAPKTLVGGLGTSVVEPSVLSTPEETGEMMVSPLSVSATVQDRSYNSEAVQRLFDNDQEASVVGATPAVEDSSEQQRPDVKTTSVATPKQKLELPECLTGVKRMMKTPRQKAEPIEDLRGKLLKTPKQKPENQECLTGVKRMMATPRREAEPVEDPPMEEPLTEPSAQPETSEQVADQTPLDEDVAKELVFALEEPTDVIDVPQDDKETVVVAVLEELPCGHDDNEPSDAVETISQAAVDENPCVEKPTVATEEKLSEEQPEVEAATIKVTEMETTAAQPDREKSVLDGTLKTVDSLAAERSDDAVVCAPVRGRRGKKTEATAPPAVRQSRGRNAKSKESPAEDQLVTEISSEAVSDQTSPVNENESTPPEEEAVVKPTRGRKPKQAAVEPPQPEQSESVTADAQPQKSIPAQEKPKSAVEQNEVAEDTVVAVETKQQPPVRAKRGRTAKQTGNHEASGSAAPLEEAVLKPKRGRKAKQPEESVTEQQDESTSHSEDVPQADATKEADAMETAPQAPVTESLPEEETATSKVTEVDAAVQKRSGRGRKVKPVESNSAEEKQEAAEVSDEAVVSAPVRGRRGKKTEAVAVETKPQPPVRAKRGRAAKQEEEEKHESTSAETTKSQEPAKKLKRTRKAEQERVEPREEAIEMVVPEEADAPLVAEPVKMSEEAAKPKRGRKATEVSSTDKVKRGTRGKRVTEEGGVTSVPEEAEEKNTAEPAAPVMKQSRARGTKTSIKTEVSQAVPAKRARRGAAALEEANAESTVQVSEPVSSTVEPARRGRRAAAKPAASEATVTSEDVSKAVVEDTNKRSVKWKDESEVFEIPKVTAVKAVRGRKSKLGGQVDAESKTGPKAADRTEEEDLLDKVVAAQPVKRTRRGPKVADVTADEAESTSQVESVEAPPKTRRGRAAKK